MDLFICNFCYRIIYIADGSLMVNNVTKVLLIISYISFVICVIALSIEIIRRMLVGKRE